MSYVPGVPNVGPSPVSPTVGKTTASKGGQTTGIAKAAAAAGKPGHSQSLGNLTTTFGSRATPKASVAGNAGAMPNSYGKGGGMPLSSSHPGTSPVRHGSGGVGSHIKSGALGPGKIGAVGPNADGPNGAPTDALMGDTE